MTEECLRALQALNEKLDEKIKALQAAIGLLGRAASESVTARFVPDVSPEHL
jgi:ribosome-binding factor A